uniref:Uncharacterized protein n=1 Tax=Octopus bimaculoides TaxID=37653 RepID=A0A0L8GJV5_OCTBM
MVSLKNMSNYCDLCLAEKFRIIQQSTRILNKQKDLISACSHMFKSILTNFKMDLPGK